MSTKEFEFRKVMTTSATATFGDSVVGVSRLQMAVEGAAKENIIQGLTEISALKLN